ncbi:hypothetical protein NM208_g8319 [Fusarium decemcellulare]|uniref:Uncharacterized protein n=1 Tax=Fusarium decemcellulare TaxID=57161 RepID=A0ACC1S620_9HYPO|nr:hypothetical protein NM208_g8319 [Fusarium decemcellulare]
MPLSPSNPLPNNSKRYFKKIPGMIYFDGRLQSEAGDANFIDPHELTQQQSLAEVYGQQPAYFEPRTDWQHLDSTNFTPYRDYDQKNTICKAAQSVPKRTWPNERQLKSSPGLVTWDTHCHDLFQLYVQMSRRDLIEDAGLLALLRILPYGIESIVEVASQPLIIGKHVDVPDSPLPPSPLPNSYDRVICDVGMGYPNTRSWRNNVQGKRFFAGLVYHYTSVHWTSFLWDRFRGQLMLYDTLNNVDTLQERLRSTLLAWREFLALAGLPYDFDYFLLPLTPQSRGLECGYLCIRALFNAVRGLVGLTHSQLGAVISPKRPDIGLSVYPPKQPFDILHRDWPLTPGLVPDTDAYDLADRQIRALFSVAVMEEIGIRDGKIWTKVKVSQADQSEKEQLVEIEGLDLVTWEPRDSTSTAMLYDTYIDIGGLAHFFIKSVGTRQLYPRHRLIPMPPSLIAPPCARPLGADVSTKPLADIPDSCNQRLQDQISIQWADIATLKVDAVVNAAHPSLTPGGGICGAIFAAAGIEELKEECNRFPGGIKAGNAVLTRGCNLPAPYIIHAVGPCKDTQYEKERAPQLLSSMYTHIFELCKANQIRKIAIPSISSGIFGIDRTLCAFEACKSAVFALLDDDLQDLEVIFVLFDPEVEKKDNSGLSPAQKSTQSVSFFLDALQANLALFGCNAFLEAWKNLTRCPPDQLKKVLKYQQRPQLEGLIAEIKANSSDDDDDDNDPYLQALERNRGWLHQLLQLASQLQ